MCEQFGCPLTVLAGDRNRQIVHSVAISRVCLILQFAIQLLQSAIDMKLSDKLKYLREVEGSLRGLGRAMTQQELVRAIAAEMDSPISQSYLSQIESGARPHLTNTTRLLLAKFFKVHPGYLVEDPEGYHAELLSDIRTQEEKLDLWLIAGSDRFRKDPELCRALRAVALYPDSRRSLLLLEVRAGNAGADGSSARNSSSLREHQRPRRQSPQSKGNVTRPESR